jgi:multiple RNA-binding domain-containing protein 1
VPLKDSLFEGHIFSSDLCMCVLACVCIPTCVYVRVYRYGVNRSDILDTAEGGGEMAVRLAIGESHVIQENRDYFAAHGVDIAALESSSSSSKAGARSTTTLLIKNLPHDCVAEELESMFNR